jgi:beta-galactosidase
MRRHARFEDGALVLSGRRRLWLAGDYPYYRDTVANWARKLARMREAGLEVVSLYIPWRHHLGLTQGGEQTFVFAAERDDNRDVLRFLSLASEAGLFALVKPGPFVHGEIQLGGLPDHTSPSKDPRRAAALSSDGEPLLSQDLALPSAFCPEFLKDAEAWIKAVWSRVIKDRVYPKGPIIGVQIGNEGVYSDVSMDIRAFDYSAPGLRRFRRSLANKYRVIDALNAAYGSELGSFGDASPASRWEGTAGLAAYLDWGEWSCRYLREFYQMWSGLLGDDVLKIINISPPALPRAPGGRPRGGLDAWLSRVQPERLAEVNYGFTSWAGNAMYDDTALVSYVLASKRRRGPNVEENWGFLWHDERYAHPITPVYHALLALAAGASGFTVYTACATASFGPQIDLDKEYLRRVLPKPDIYDPPYCGEAPISVDGKQGKKFGVLALLTHFFRAEGEELLGCAPPADITWGLYAPYSYVAAWDPPPAERYKGLRLPAPASEGLVELVVTCLARGADLKLLSLETAADRALAAHKRVVLAGSFFMDEAVQEKLAAYVEGGGTLAMLWESPLYNERRQFCEIIQERLFGHTLLDQEGEHFLEALGEPTACRPLRQPDGAEPLLVSSSGVHGYVVQRGAGRAMYLDIVPSARGAGFLLDALGARGLMGPEVPGSGAPFIVAAYTREADKTAFVFVLSREDRGSVLKREIWGTPLEIRLVGRGAAVVKVKRGRLSGCFVKGVNEVSGEGAPPWVRYGQDEITADAPCDLSVVLDSDRFDVKTAGGSRAPRVTLPRAPGRTDG